MGEVLDIMSRLPRSEKADRVFDAHFVDLRFLARATKAILWGWTSRHGDIDVDELPSELTRRIGNMVTRHVQGPSRIAVDVDDDDLVISFNASGDEGVFSYAFSVDKRWGQA